MTAAQRSPIYALINRFKVALPLHPEYRTMPMVWYIPPLSPVVDVVKDTGYDAEDKGNLFAAIDALRIPIEYLAELFTAGEVAPVDRVLKKLAAMRSYMRDINMGRDPNPSIPAAVGMTEETIYDMYRLLAIAKYDERYVIPAAHAEQGHALEEIATECSVSEYGGGKPGASSVKGRVSQTPIAVENFRMLQDRQTADTVAASPGKASRVNLLNWDGKGVPDGFFPSPLPEDGRVTSGVRDPYATAGAPSRSADEQLTVAWQASSLLLGYPDQELLGRSRPDRGGVRPAARPGGRAAAGVRPAAPRGAAVRAGGRTTSTRSTTVVDTTCSSPTSRTATLASAGWRCCGSSRPTSPRGSSSRDDRAARPPLRGAGVRRHRRPRAGPPADPRPPRRARAAAASR